MILNNVQILNGVEYSVSELIEASKDLKVVKIKVADVFIDYQSPCHNSLVDFISHYKRTRDSKLKYPIILSPCNFILDGKHRIAKAVIDGEKYIKAVRFKTMPDIGRVVDNN